MAKLKDIIIRRISGCSACPFKSHDGCRRFSAYAHVAFCECVKEEVEERVLRLLHDDADMRKAFLDKIATPIANKMFECGLIP